MNSASMQTGDAWISRVPVVDWPQGRQAFGSIEYKRGGLITHQGDPIMAIKRVLVVDDNASDRANLERIVSGAGYTVIMAAGGKDALQMAKSEKPDLIFMDVVMPDVDGFAATRALKADGATKNIPVVFVTSKNQKADKVWAEMQGGSDLVGKPFGNDEILSQLKKVA
jgi:twitching motility two-component system response regulator PilH